MLTERAYVPGMSPGSPAPVTAEELLTLSIPDKRVELVRGMLVVREPAGYAHGRVAMNLAVRLATYVEGARAGQVFAAETGFTLARGPDTVRAPDVAFVTHERLPPPSTTGYPALAPDLVVEVLSPDDRPGEMLGKVADWLSAGTRIVWVVDWLGMRAGMSGAPLVDGLLPRGLARAATRRVAQQQDPLAAFRARIGAVPIQAQPLAENLTLLSGPGGNVVVLGGADGLVMVDTFVSPAWPRLQESLKGLGGTVKFVINTHWHFDHTDNNAPLHAAGATLVAHENTKLRMTQPHHLAVLELDFPPSPASALPQRVFKEGYKLEANGERLTVTHVPPAHTDTDVVVQFEKAKVLHTGDVFFNGRYPFVDWSTGGRHAGMIAAEGPL